MNELNGDYVRSNDVGGREYGYRKTFITDCQVSYTGQRGVYLLMESVAPCGVMLDTP